MDKNAELKQGLGGKLMALRLERKISQPEMAKMLETTQNAVWRYENGRATPPLVTLVSYADIFDVSLDWLLGRTNKKEGRNFSGVFRSDRERMTAFATALLSGDTEIGKRFSSLVKETFMKGENENEGGKDDERN